MSIHKNDPNYTAETMQPAAEGVQKAINLIEKAFEQCEYKFNAVDILTGLAITMAMCIGGDHFDLETSITKINEIIRLVAPQAEACADQMEEHRAECIHVNKPVIPGGEA